MKESTHTGDSQCPVLHCFNPVQGTIIVIPIIRNPDTLCCLPLSLSLYPCTQARHCCIPKWTQVSKEHEWCHPNINDRMSGKIHGKFPFAFKYRLICVNAYCCLMYPAFLCAKV